MYLFFLCIFAYNQNVKNMEYLTKEDLKEQERFYFWLRFKVKSKFMNKPDQILKAMSKIKSKK